MTAWTDAQLDGIGAATEIDIAPRRDDGSLRPYSTVWVVRAENGLYVRSWSGPNGRWFTTARDTHEGRVRAGGVEHDVSFQDANYTPRGAIDAAYRDKYGRSKCVDSMLTDDVAATTLRLVPR